MIKDLSKNEHSATSAFISILPNLEDIRDSDSEADEKLENARNLIIQTLCKFRNSDDEKKSISQDYIISVRMTIAKHRNVEQILNYINNAINKGKNYSEGEN